jgi:phosphatidylglycerol---prolipoprotein diacylglyceryl transferase
MWQEIFRIPIINLPVYGYGLMMVIGFLVAIEVAKKLAKQKGLDPEIFVNAALIALVTGVAGARLSHVLENIGDYTRSDRSFGANLFDAINIRSGGLTFYGGFLLAFPTLIIYAMKKKLPVKLGMDIIAPCLMVGLGFGRIGCFMNGCCYGPECSVPWAVQFPYGSNAYVEQVDRHMISAPPQLMVTQADGSARLMTPDEARSDPQLKEIAAANRALPVHPSELYSSFTAFLLACLLLAYFTMPHAPGRVFALMLMLEGASRFILEMVRVEPAVFGTAFSLSMWIGMMLAGLGLLLWIVFGLQTVPEPLFSNSRHSTSAGNPGTR